MPPKLVMQTLNQLWLELQKSEIQVAVAGGIALSFWGHPRSTQDIDLSVLANNDDALTPLLRKMGMRLKSSRPLPLELFHLSQWTFEPDDAFVEVEIDLLIGDSDYYRSVLSRARQVHLEGVAIPVQVLTVEDLILHKLFAQRLIDQADVLTMFELHFEELEHVYLHFWADRLGLNETLEVAIGRYRDEQP